LNNLASNDAVAQTDIYTRLTNRLVSAGAECVCVTSIAGHFCIDDFKAVSPLPVVDMIAEVSRAIETRGLKRIGIIGTRTVMETRFYGRIASAEIVPPSKPDLDDVHEAYISMAASGFVTEDQRSIFNAASHRLIGDQGAEAIMLGGTDLAGLQRTECRIPAGRLCGHSCRCDCTVGDRLRNIDALCDDARCNGSSAHTALLRSPSCLEIRQKNKSVNTLSTHSSS
jgi:hypothetical protein